ncbi:AI-2E family transporter [Proteiniclasticum sp.]|uniref:AI-2E family transporter n=1 Tax=Proteiniclasticum sp. TaxID=2053595 RepID=UPI0028969613|nr:AI-2E family transporter [Proteiniclasticum sp.]
MKIEWNRKYTTIAVYAFIVLASAGLFFIILSGLSEFTLAIGSYISILYPFLYGFVIAYILNFFMVFAEKWLNKTTLREVRYRKFRKVLALVLAYFFAAAFIALFLAFILPQLISSITGLVKELPRYIQNISDFISQLSETYTFDQRIVEFLNERWIELGDALNNLAKDLLPMTLDFLRNTAMSIWNIFLGIVISLYLLADKTKFAATGKKVIYGLLTPSHATKVLELLGRTQRIFSKFLVGKVLDSLIVGIIAFVALSIFKMPYVILISFIIAVTNIIPFFGPFIGAVPSFIIIFFVSPIQALWFLLFIFLLQQLDGNYIGPKILGDSLGISSFWILFAILVGGKVLGFAGLIAGVPLFVLIYSIIKEYVEMKLKNKGMPESTDAYETDGYIEPIYKAEE